MLGSHPTRGEWIEMLSVIVVALSISLTPHGVSGLKSAVRWVGEKLNPSHPTRGEWIEISVPAVRHRRLVLVSPHTG